MTIYRYMGYMLESTDSNIYPHLIGERGEGVEEKLEKEDHQIEEEGEVEKGEKEEEKD